MIDLNHNTLSINIFQIISSSFSNFFIINNIVYKYFNLFIYIYIYIFKKKNRKKNDYVNIFLVWEILRKVIILRKTVNFDCFSQFLYTYLILLCYL